MSCIVSEVPYNSLPDFFAAFSLLRFRNLQLGKLRIAMPVGRMEYPKNIRFFWLGFHQFLTFSVYACPGSL